MLWTKPLREKREKKDKGREKLDGGEAQTQAKKTGDHHAAAPVEKDSEPPAYSKEKG